MVLVSFGQLVSGFMGWSEFIASPHLIHLLEGFGLGCLRAGVAGMGTR